MSDLIVVGAGAAGLSAAVRVARAGFSVQIVEARDRIGGRIFTLRDPVCHAPVELGAEFIHGLPSEIWKPLQKYKTAIAEVTGEPWCSEDGRLSRCQFFSSVDNILKKMNCRGRDESFLSFLDRRFSASDSNKQEARRRALAYVTGFNAADPNTVGVHWLVQSMQAEEKIEGDRSFRSRNGYNDLLDIFRGELMETGVRVQTGIVVESIAWSPDHAIVRANHGRRSLQLGAKRILVTLPIGVLQAGERQPGTVQFLPGLPVNKLHAIRKMRMGKVIRATLRFRTPFWKTIRAEQTHTKSLSDMNFLFTRDELFPTWWTSTPESTPLITGWAPARSAERLSGKSQAFVVDRAVHSLAAALRTRPSRLESLLDDTYCHDWQSDPFSRGAYSYGAVGSDGAQQDLARPLENTLFFAGEATDTTGHNGTVHGAIASGHRAASQILLSLR